jgi:DNA adenine methylase
MISDFEEVIDSCVKGDFIFVDPPYRPGAKELKHDHYVYSKFTYEDHKRLANTLKQAAKRKLKWAITTSDHKDIVSLFSSYRIIQFTKGTGRSPGLLSGNSGEVLICNY